MGTIAIAANPASGRDIRRLVSHATVYSNREKENIVERVILAAYAMGGHKAIIMPDSFGFGIHIQRHLEEDLLELPRGVVNIPDVPYMDKQEDTTYFAAYAEQQGCDVLVVLGGDGTSRAAAKGVEHIPVIALSTGTNNVYPDMVEGTIAGVAASAIADGVVSPKDCCLRSKSIEIYVNGEYADRALVDVAFCPFVYTGAKAIWKRESLRRIMVTQCHPASIGFSALLGCAYTILPEDDYGAAADFEDGRTNVRVAVSAGVVSDFRLERERVVPLDEKLTYVMDYNGMLALDGEREVKFRSGDTVDLVITRQGPNKVDIRKTLMLAQRAGYFQKELREEV